MFHNINNFPIGKGKVVQFPYISFLYIFQKINSNCRQISAETYSHNEVVLA